MKRIEAEIANPDRWQKSAAWNPVRDGECCAEEVVQELVNSGVERRVPKELKPGANRQFPKLTKFKPSATQI
jgi:hypothetical protein